VLFNYDIREPCTSPAEGRPTRAPVLCAGDLPGPTENTWRRRSAMHRAVPFTDRHSYKIIYSGFLRVAGNASICLIPLVGAGRFERPTPCAQGRCATRLRYAPTVEAPLILNHSRVSATLGAEARGCPTRRRPPVVDSRAHPRRRFPARTHPPVIQQATRTTLKLARAEPGGCAAAATRPAPTRGPGCSA
jgi:hypothetical protein